LKVWDPDNDGTIDLAEAKKAAEAKFSRLQRRCAPPTRLLNANVERLLSESANG
jgi:hypothetical protein